MQIVGQLRGAESAARVDPRCQLQHKPEPIRKVAETAPKALYRDHQ
jgi:hypothetical protein